MVKESAAGTLTKKIWFKVNAPLTTAFLSYRAHCASFRVFVERALVWGHAEAGIASRVAYLEGVSTFALAV